MNQGTLAWAAFKNMMRQAGRDPVWAISCIIMAPFRAGRYLLQVGLFILIVTLALAVAANGIPHEWWIARGIAGLVVLLVFFRAALSRPHQPHDYAFRGYGRRNPRLGPLRHQQGSGTAGPRRVRPADRS
ncbi:hypothetical protein MESS2_p190004 [Mesorhizobium metallidurans STM 2683]|uniref:Uncharacterized protein n=1 Tax=Mesorhizobium metallidurans STM 2683 TaxID=1297569 RepID=M5FC45_9HYPH|nr:hypothetical protein MESS2_p190004 [Mesorhizobium metallidurans STM 2683]